MTHDEFLSKAVNHYREVVLFMDTNFKVKIYTVWSVKVANNSKVILADSETNTMCEATLIGSKNLIVYDFYTRFKHEERTAI